MMDYQKIDELLGYLSDIYNKSLPLYELITTRSYDRSRALLNINELYTDYNSLTLFLKLHPGLANEEVKQFLKYFDEFYFELKQVFFQEDSNTALLYHKLTTMKETFETLNSDLETF